MGSQRVLTAKYVEGLKNLSNYVNNPEFLKNIQYWNAFTTVYSLGIPTTITLGAAGATIAHTTLNPLTLTTSGNLQLAKPASNCRGQGVITDIFTIDRKLIGALLEWSFAYEIISGILDISGGATQSIEIWLYDVTAGTWINSAKYRGINSLSIPSYIIDEFQTANNSTHNQYRLALIINDATSNAWSVNFANFYVGPYQLTNIPPDKTMVSANDGSILTSSLSGDIYNFV